MNAPEPESTATMTEQRVDVLLARMTLAEKIGQMCQLNASESNAPDHLGDGLRAGRIGAVLNVVDVAAVNKLQRIAVEESRLGIPLLVGRDVIHGFKTVMPIPLGQAATWNPDMVLQAAQVAAGEASAAGINWTFAPMIDVARDPRWGRIAESLGEDPYLASVLGAAMVAGFQGDELSAPGSIAACAKHFAGYGTVESGRDYASTYVSENEMRNVYLRPFKAAVAAGVSTLMASFSDVDGVPATANEFLMRQVLRDEWQFDGFVVSDWDSIRQLQIHGLTEDDKDSAQQAAIAGIDMEMAGDAYSKHLAELVEDDQLSIAVVDAAVASILRIKFRLGLFENPYTTRASPNGVASDNALEVARKTARQSIVMLKNDNGALPLQVRKLKSVAIIGPLADAPYQQLGTWIFDGDAGLSVTPLRAIQDLIGDRVEIQYARAMETSRSNSTDQFKQAVDAASAADVTILFLGEESILSGEAHSRADISLPGAQAELVRRIRQANKHVIAVILAGRPLTLTDVVDELDAILYAWHPGTMAGPAIADLLFGSESPSGKLPVTFPRMVGQIPIYYSQKNTGKPPSPESIVHIDDIDPHAQQLSLGMTSFHLDAGYTPLFAFGHGLSYADFCYRDVRTSTPEIRMGECISIYAELTNAGDQTADEIAQLYVRDLVANVTRPVRELKGFQRLRLEPDETVTLRFDLHTDDLAFYGRSMQLMTEPGEFHVWIGGSSETQSGTSFRITEDV